jgi:hypothetical protein
VHDEIKSTTWRITKSPPREIMTAAKSKSKRPKEPKQTNTPKDKPTERETSSRPVTIKQEDKREERVREKTTQECTGDCKEICKEGADWIECALSCEVTKQHDLKDCRCKFHATNTGKETFQLITLYATPAETCV